MWKSWQLLLMYKYMQLLPWIRNAILLAILQMIMQLLPQIRYANSSQCFLHISNFWQFFMYATFTMNPLCEILGSSSQMQILPWIRYETSWQCVINAPFAMNPLCDTLGNSAYLYATFAMNPLWKSIGNSLSMQILPWIRYVKLLAILHICPFCHEYIMQYSWQFCISICNFYHESIMKISWQFFKYANFGMNPLCDTFGNSSYMQRFP